MNQILNLFRCSKSVQIVFLLQKYDSFCFYHLHSIHPINTTINDKAENIQKTGKRAITNNKPTNFHHNTKQTAHAK